MSWKLARRLRAGSLLLSASLLSLGVSSSLAGDAYLEVNGRVVVEAEHFEARTEGSGKHWHVVPDEDVYPTDYPIFMHSQARGGKYMVVLPDQNNNSHSSATTWNTDPFLDVKVRITTPGLYRLFLRWRGWDGNNDSLYAQIVGKSDGAGGTINDWYCFVDGTGTGFNGTWRGSAYPENTSGSGTKVESTWDLTPGEYTVRISYREDGCAVDSVCLQLQTMAAPGDSVPESPTLQPGPFVWSANPAANQAGVSPLTAYRVQIRDGANVALNADNPTLTLNGTPLTITNKVKVAEITTIDAPSLGMLAKGSVNTLVLVYKDANNVSYTNTWDFNANVWTDLPVAYKLTAAQVDTTKPGFAVRIHQALTQTNDVIYHRPSLPNNNDRAEGQLRGYLIDTNTPFGLPHTNGLRINSSDLPGVDPISVVWGDEIDPLNVPETYLNWNIYPALHDAGTDQGNFQYNSGAPDGYGFPDQPPPGYANRVDLSFTNNQAAEIITFLELPAGYVRLGVNSDDGFRVISGLNLQERYDTNKFSLLGQFEGGRGASDTVFDMLVAEAGYYPIRILWYNGDGGSNIEFFEMLPDGTRRLVNDVAYTGSWKAGTAGSLKAYRAATLPPASAVVDWLSPAPNAQNIASNATLQVQLGDGNGTVVQSSVKLLVNGGEVAPVKTQAGSKTRLSYVANPLLNGGTNTAEVQFTDSLGNSITQAWSFVVVQGGSSGAVGEITRKIWTQNTGSLANFTNSAVFVQNIDYNTNGEPTVLNSFEQAQFNPAVDNYGQQWLGYLKPEVSAEYTFYMSSDDASELYLSTTDSPADMVRIAFQNGYSGNREYLTARNPYTRRSAPIALEAGKRYFVMALHKEGTGGDNFSVTWWKPGDPAIVNGSAPISGSVLEKFVGAAYTSQPLSQTVKKGQSVIFSASALIGVGNVSYQWYKGTQAIGGANGLTYTIPKAALTDAGDYKLRTTVDGVPYETATATLTVIDDTAPPVVVSCKGMTDPLLVPFGSLGAHTVAIEFDDTLDAISVQNANIEVSGGNAVAFRSLGTNSTQILLLNLVAAPSASFTVTLSGITDLAGNALPNGTVVNGTTAALTPMVMGNVGTDPMETGGTAAYGIGTNGYYVSAGGSDIWNAADAGHYLYTQYTGDFDAVVRVEWLTRANDWSKAGIMVREDLEANSRNVFVATTPLPLNNLYTHQWRDTKGGGSGSKPDRATGVTYPNAWIRMVREQNTFTSFIKTNGVDWVQYHQYVAPSNYPAQVYVGLATTSHDNAINDITVAIYRDWSINPYSGAPPMLSAPSVDGNGLFTMQVTAGLGLPYRLLATTNLSLPMDQWTVVSQGTINAVPMTLTDDTGMTNYPSRFYRYVSP